jgi:dihydroneopterin aldolase
VTDHISLTGLEVLAKHGVLASEKENEQLFIVDIDLGLDLAEAGDSDDLRATVDYGALAESIHRVVSDESHALIETVAERVAAEVLSDGRVETVRVTVHKPNAPIERSFADVSITLERSR